MSSHVGAADAFLAITASYLAFLTSVYGFLMVYVIFTVVPAGYTYVYTIILLDVKAFSFTKVLPVVAHLQLFDASI